MMVRVLQSRLNQETARVRWSELARHFAGGRLLRVAPRLDLVAVAAAVAEDDAEQVNGWVTLGDVAPVTDLEAQTWQAADAVLWAVVVKPFVLVQSPTQDD